MKISSKILSKYFFIYIGFIIAILFLFMISTSSMTAEHISAERGLVVIDKDLGDVEYSLVGYWEYYANEFLYPEDFANKNITKEYSYVDIDGSQLNGTQGTYSITIDNQSYNNILMQFPVFKGSYKVFLNDELVSYTILNWDEKPIPSVFRQVNIPLLRNATNRVIVQMSRDDYFLFGFTYAPTIATETYYINETAELSFQKAIVGVTIVAVLLFLLIIYSGSYGTPKSHIPLFYLWGAVAITYLQYIVPFYVKVVNYYEYTKLFSFSLVLSAYFVYVFIYKSFPEIKVSKGFFEGSTWIVSFQLIFIIFSSSEYSSLSYRLSLIVFLYLLCSALHFTTLALNKKNREAVYIFVIVSMLTLSFAINIKYIHLYKFNTLIFVTYTMCFLVIMAKLVNENRIYALTYKNIEYDLTHKSKLKHKELIEYNDVLLAEIVARKEAEQSLVEITTKDYLTGLYNRLYGNSKLTTFVEKFQNDGSVFSIIMIDIDNFKYINDTYGHDCGDEVIKILAKVMLSSTRHSDIVTRWGGEEFLVILPNAKIESAIYVSEKIRKGIETCIIPVVGNVTASLGVAEVREGEDYEATIVRSDENLYLAKKNGKNCTYPRL